MSLRKYAHQIKHYIQPSLCHCPLYFMYNRDPTFFNNVIFLDKCENIITLRLNIIEGSISVLRDVFYDRLQSMRESYNYLVGCILWHKHVV